VATAKERTLSATEAASVGYYLATVLCMTLAPVLVAHAAFSSLAPVDRTNDFTVGFWCYIACALVLVALPGASAFLLFSLVARREASTARRRAAKCTHPGPFALSAPLQPAVVVFCVASFVALFSGVTLTDGGPTLFQCFIVSTPVSLVVRNGVSITLPWGIPVLWLMNLCFLVVGENLLVDRPDDEPADQDVESPAPWYWPIAWPCLLATLSFAAVAVPHVRCGGEGHMWNSPLDSVREGIAFGGFFITMVLWHLSALGAIVTVVGHSAVRKVLRRPPPPPMAETAEMDPRTIFRICEVGWRFSLVVAPAMLPLYLLAWLSWPADVPTSCGPAASFTWLALVFAANLAVYALTHRYPARRSRAMLLSRN